MEGKKGQEELRKGTLKCVHFLFQTQRRRKEKTLAPGSQEHAVHKNRRVKRRAFLAEPKELNLKHRAKKKNKNPNTCIQLDVCLTAQECGLTVGPQ